MFGPKLFLTPHICEIFFFYCHVIFFHSCSRSRVFLGMIASDSHSRIVGMDFFHSLPVPEFWEQIFSFPSHSRFLGMVFFHSLPVPELREWVFSIPFPFPNFGNGIIHSRSRSRTPKCHSRSPLQRAQLLTPTANMTHRSKIKTYPQNWSNSELKTRHPIP